MKKTLQFGLAVLLAVGLCLAQTPEQVQARNKARTQGSASPADSLRNAQVQRKQLEAAASTRRHVLEDSTQANVAPLAPTAPPNWTPMGPFGIRGPEGAQAGRVTSVVTDTRYPNLVYVAAAGGGIWRSADAGNSWQSLGDNLLSMASGTLALDQRIGAQGALYYGTGDYTGSTYGIGVLKSTDGGNTWQELSTQFEHDPFGQTLRIALHPTDPQTLFLARQSGVWRSTDGGNSWSNVLPGFATDVVINSNGPNLLFAALGNPGGDKVNGVYRSIDGGNTWQIVNALPAGIPVGRVSLALTPASAATVVALFATSGDYSLNGLYRSDDFGATWRPLGITNLLFFNTTVNYNRGWYDQLLTIDPASANNIYVGGEQLYRSRDGGQSFLPLTLNPSSGQSLTHEGMFGMAFQVGSPDSYYLATEGGIYRTADGGQNWFNLNQSLLIAQIDAVAVNPGSTEILAAGESNGLMSLSGELSTWTQLLRGNAGSVFFDPFQSGSVYGGQVQVTPQRSSDFGTTWNAAASGIALNDPTGYAYYYAPFVADPNLSGNLLFGTTRVWRSTNSGNSWSAVSPQLATSGNNLTVIAVAPNSGRTYAATNDGRVWVSADGATGWQEGSGLPLHYVSTLAADPSSPLRAYLGVWGYDSGHVFRTVDGGVSWQDVSGALPNIPVNSIVVDPRGPVYAATDIGVFRFAGGVWTSFSQGLPNTLVTSLAFDAISDRLIGGTFGRGAFQVMAPAPNSTGPSIQARGIVDAASGFTILAPATVGSIYGTNLTDVSGFPSVTVNGVTALVLGGNAKQINFLVPSGIGASQATVTVTTQTGSVGAFVQMAPVAPGIYPNRLVHANGTLVTSANPARTGETVTLSASGLGDTVGVVGATINGIAAQVPFAGPGNQGVYPVNVTVPAGVTGDIALLISSGSRVSNPVTISIR